MKKILKYLKKYWLFALLAPLFMVLEVFMDLLQPRLIQKIIDIGIAEQNLQVIINNGLLMFLFAVIALIGGIGCSIFAVITAQNVGADIRNSLFEKIQHYSFKKLDDSESGNLITILTNDIDILERLIFMALRVLVRAPLMAVGSMVMAFIISPKLSLIILIYLPLLFIIVYFVNKKVYPIYSKVQQKMDQLNTVVQENLAGIRVIKSFVRSDYENERFNQVNEDYMQTNMTAARIMALIMPLVMLIVNLGVAFIIYFGGIEVIAGSLAVGEIVAFINYLLRLLFSLMMAGMIMINYSRASVSADRVVEILESSDDLEEIDILDTAKKLDLKGEIEFRNVHFSYSKDKDNAVLNNISFKIQAGAKAAIMGETASGKSTLIRLISGLYEPDSGEIFIDGKNIKDYRKKDLRKSIAFVLQDSILFSDTVENNIAYAKEKITEAEIKRAAKVAQADSFINKFEAGYQHKVEQRGVNLSGGQKQRLAIARALAADTDIIIFDDSTSAVDLKTEAKIMKALKKESENKTIIIVAQKIASVLNADKIFLLDKGKIAASGTHEELLNKNKEYQNIYYSQFGEEEKNA